MSDLVNLPIIAAGNSTIVIQSGEDEIVASLVPQGSGFVGLQAGNGITWGKHIRLIDTGNELGKISTQDNNRGPYWMALPPGFSGWVEFVKNKMFNVETGMYVALVIPLLKVPAGMSVLFTWVRD